MTIKKISVVSNIDRNRQNLFLMVAEWCRDYATADMPASSEKLRMQQISRLIGVPVTKIIQSTKTSVRLVTTKGTFYVDSKAETIRKLPL